MVHRCNACDGLFRESISVLKIGARGPLCHPDDQSPAEYEVFCPLCLAPDNFCEADDVWECCDCGRQFDKPVMWPTPGKPNIAHSDETEHCPHCGSGNIDEGVEPEVVV